MNLLWNIGFNATTNEEFNILFLKIMPSLLLPQPDNDMYEIYTDPSGAELWVLYNKLNRDNKFFLLPKNVEGIAPHFNGKGKIRAFIDQLFVAKDGDYEGGFIAYTNPGNKKKVVQGMYPFVFNVPDFKSLTNIQTSANYDIQLTALTLNLAVYSDKAAYEKEEKVFAVNSFVPVGYFQFGNQKSENMPYARASISGTVKSLERKQNDITKAAFYWLLVETLIGEIDVVAHIGFFENEPQIGNIVKGDFWLSGKIYPVDIRKSWCIEIGNKIANFVLNRKET